MEGRPSGKTQLLVSSRIARSRLAPGLYALARSLADILDLSRLGDGSGPRKEDSHFLTPLMRETSSAPAEKEAVGFMSVLVLPLDESITCPLPFSDGEVISALLGALDF